jgi:hypothetical protein
MAKKVAVKAEKTAAGVEVTEERNGKTPAVAKKKGAPRKIYYAQKREDLPAEMRIVYDALPSEDLKKKMLGQWRVPSPTSIGIVDKQPKLEAIRKVFAKLRDAIDTRIGEIDEYLEAIDEDRSVMKDIAIRPIRAAIEVEGGLAKLKISRGGGDEDTDEEESEEPEENEDTDEEESEEE